MNRNIDNLKIDVVIDGFPIEVNISEVVGAFTGIHFHPFFEIHFIVAGQYRINLSDNMPNNEMIVYSDDIIIVPPEMKHSIIPVGDAGTYERTSFWVDFGKLANKNKSSFILNAFTDIRDIVIINQFSELIKMINTVRCEIEHKKTYYLEFVKNEIINIMILICRNINQYTGGHLAVSTAKKNIIVSIKNYINANYSGKCTLKKLSNELYMSERQLSQLVRKYYSRSFRQLLLETRMSMANYLIKENNMAFCEVAVKTGYGSIEAFYHSYSKFYGMTPTEYMKRVKTEILQS